MKITITIVLVLFISANIAQSSSNGGLNIPLNNYGISFGNSKVFSGIRFNFKDENIENINGINFTIWQPEFNENSVFNGLFIGGAPNAGIINGVTFGVTAILAHESVNGLNIAGLATVSEGSINGVSVGGLALVSEGNQMGVNIGGLACVSSGNITGISLGGLACVAEEGISGINFGGLAVVSEGRMFGLNLSGLASVSKNGVYGLSVSGLAIVASEGISGFQLAGLGIVSGESIYGLNLTLGKLVSETEIKGISIAGYKTETETFSGINISPVWCEFYELYGASISMFNNVQGSQYGISIGILNIAEVLNGLQIGLINIANNNPVPFRILPILNANF